MLLSTRLSPRTQLQGIQTDSGRQIEYASDSRFKIQGAREKFALHLES